MKFRVAPWSALKTLAHFGHCSQDKQEDKKPLFDTVDTLKDTLRIFAEMVGGITVKPEAMERAALKGYATRDRPGRLPRQEGLAVP